MGKDSTQTQTQSVDPATQQYIQAYRARAAQQYQNAQQPWANPYMNNAALGQAQGGYQNLLNTGQQNLDAASHQFGGAADLSNFLNPYQQQVTGAVQSNFDRQRTQALNAAAGNATSQGAFGGSRSGVLQAQALNDVNQNETGTLADLNRQGYSQALGAYQNQQQLLGNLGLGAAGAGAAGLGNIGQFQAQGTANLNQAQQQYLAQLLGMQQGGFQPTSQTNTRVQKGNLWGDILGAAGVVGGALIGRQPQQQQQQAVSPIYNGSRSQFQPPQFGSSFNLGMGGQYGPPADYNPQDYSTGPGPRYY